MDKPPLPKLVILGIISLIGITILPLLKDGVQGHLNAKNDASNSEFAVVEGNSYIAPRIPDTPYIYTLGVLVDCLSFYESNHNPNAVGKAGEIGCMQFKSRTFQYYCVEKYGLVDDIWDCEIQMECADRMIKDGGINHWTTKNNCL